MQKSLGLYVHIPFCEKKCPYCDFVSYDDKKGLEARYVECVVRQIIEYAPFTRGYTLDSMYIGGGTPTCLEPRLLKKLLMAIKKGFSISPFVEFTCEANPKSALDETLSILKKGGVNRLSLGLQSADADELEWLGRIHSLDTFKKAFESARKAGFDNINVDLMLSVPGQSKKSLADSLSTVLALSPEHISAYSLKINENTPYYALKDTLPLGDEELDRELYRLCTETLVSSGFEHYEISNFARPGKKSRHNLRYWNCEEYIGLGCSAHSFFAGKRFSFIADIDGYIKAVSEGKAVVRELMDIDSNERVGEYIMLRLRLSDGIEAAEFERRFGFSFTTAFGPQIEKYKKGGYLIEKDGCYSLTLEGIFISNYIISDFLEW